MPITNADITAELERLRAERELLRESISQQRSENATAVTFEGQSITRPTYDILIKDEARLTNRINELIWIRRFGAQGYQFARKLRP